jgi:Holliday junction resolvase RusA-like endonuclease
MISIILRGRIPSKKNSKIIVCRGKYPILLSSPAYNTWNEEQLWYLKGLRCPRSIEKCKVDITFYAPDKRATDLSNKTESIMDLLVDAGILKDDNWYVVSELTLRFGGVDKENPRAEILIDNK